MIRGGILFLIAIGSMVAQIAPANSGSPVVALQTAPTTLHPDTAYLLLRTSTAKSGMFSIQHVFLRIPSEQELQQFRSAKQSAYAAALPELTKRAKDGKIPSIDEFEFDYSGPSNTFVVESKIFLEDGEMRTLLIEMPPGIYILYGTTLGSRGLVACNCLGTLSFEAKPGVITDIGSLYADKVHKPSPIPHLEDNLGPSMFQYGLIFGEALIPSDAATKVPEALRSLAYKRAEFNIVHQYYEPGAGSINRLAPIPGLLGYKHGKPVDLRTGQAAQ